MANELPAADPASPWMQHLERAHGLAHRAAAAVGEESEPSPYLAPAAEQIARAVAAMYDAFDGRADRVTALNLAHGRLWDAAVLVARAGLPRALSPLREACRALVDAEERFPDVPLADRPAAVLKAAVDLLPLHVVDRPSLLPSFRAPPRPELEQEEMLPPLPEAKTFEELAAVARMMALRADEQRARRRPPEPATEALPAAPELPPPGFAVRPPPAIGEDAFCQRWARYCFDEIGMLGVQRTPLAGDGFRTSLPIERRLFHALDAIAALGPAAVASLEPLALDAPAGAALDRLLGAKLTETIEIPPDDVEEVMVVDPDPEPPKQGPALAALVGDPLEPPPAGSPETLEVASIDPARWRAYWAEHGGKLDREQRVRRGQGYSPSVSPYELDALPLGPADRRTLHRELAARTGKLARFDPHDLVVVQEQSLAEWGALVKATAEVPGSWERARRR